MARPAHALLFLALLTSAALLELAQAASQSDRDVAVAATKRSKPKRGSAGKMQDGTNKSVKFAECMNSLSTNVGAQRQKGTKGAKARDKQKKFDDATDTCVNLKTFDCDDSSIGSPTPNSTTPSNTTDNSTDYDTTNTTNTTNSIDTANTTDTGSRRRLLDWITGTNMRKLSSEEATAHLRELLAAANADDGDFEPATSEMDDEDDAAFAETVASNLSPEDIDDLCTTAQDEVVAQTLRAYSKAMSMGPEQVQAASSSGVATAGLLSGYRRSTIAQQVLQQVTQENNELLSTSGGVQAASASTTDCRQDLSATTPVKATTGGRVTCNNNQLARGVAPAYKTNTGFGGFVSCVRPLLPSFVTLGPSTNDGRWAEYSDGNAWGNAFLVSNIAEKALLVLEKILSAFDSACEISGAASFWVGVGGGPVSIAAKVVCDGAKIPVAIGLLVVKLAFVEGPRIALAAADQHDLIINSYEAEAITENVMSVIHNQNMTHKQLCDVNTSTIATVQSESAVAKNEIRMQAGDARTTIQQRAQALQTEVTGAISASETATAASIAATAGATDQIILDIMQELMNSFQALDTNQTNRLNALDTKLSNRIQALDDKLSARIQALDDSLTALAQRRTCDLQNAVANTHNTVNQIQRLMLAPEGQRAGFNKVGAVATCDLSAPAVCFQAQRNSTGPVNATTVCGPGAVAALSGVQSLATQVVSATATTPGV